MAKSPPHNLDEILDRLPQYMEIAAIPGLAMTLIADHQVMSTYAFGVKSAATQEPVAADTVFQAASLSKPVFAYAVLSLCDEGLIDLDRPLSDYLPESYAPHEPQIQRITARHVLSHTSGLPNWRFEPGELLHVATPPGERFAYSGEGYFYLQRVVEQVAGQPIEAFMQERVLQPLGMARSSYLWRPEHEQQLAMGHRDRGQPAEPWNAWQGRRMLELAAQWDQPLSTWRYADVERALPDIHPDLAPLPNNMIPNVAGSLLTTAPEFAAFMLRILTKETLSENTRRAMLAPQIQLNSALSWGLGWGLEHSAGQDYFWHWGENGLFENFAVGDPQRGSGVVILTNGSGGLKICQRIVRAVTGHDHAAFLWL